MKYKWFAAFTTSKKIPETKEEYEQGHFLEFRRKYKFLEFYKKTYPIYKKTIFKN